MVTSIIVFLSMMVLINFEPAGITAEGTAITPVLANAALPEIQPNIAPESPTKGDATTVQADSNPSPQGTTVTPDLNASNKDKKDSPDIQVQTEAVTSPPKTKPVKETPKTNTVTMPTPAYPGATAQQQEMLGYINAARAQANLNPLTLDSRLCSGTYLKSKDMAVNGYFNHTSPTYGSPFEMMRSMGITYRTAAENIARNSSVLAAHNAFMNSSGHKANILNPAFNRIGLGFYQRGSDLFVTQWFTN